MIEHRKHSNETEDARLLRLSIGIEDIDVSLSHSIAVTCIILMCFGMQDLKADFRQALNEIAKEKARL